MSHYLKQLRNRIEVFFRKNIFEGIIMKKQIEKFYYIFGGHIFFQVLNAAIKFDLFTLLSANPGMTRAVIASRLGIEEQPARILLMSLVSIGLLRKKGETYRNSTLSERLLSRTSPRNMIAYVHLQNNAMYKAMPHFYESLKTYKNVGLSEFEGSEPTLYQRLSHNPELEQIFQDSMQQLSGQANDLLAKFVDLSGVRNFVDVGGGDATNIITLAKHFPDLRASVFDLPPAEDIAKDNIKKSGLSNRLHFVAGDCFVDPFPRGTDCFLFSHFFTIWSEEKDKLLLKKTLDALPSGGKVIIFNMMQNNDESGPLSAAVGSPYFLTLATGEGMLYTWDEYERWMKEVGFTKVSKFELPTQHGILVGTK